MLLSQKDIDYVSAFFQKHLRDSVNLLLFIDDEKSCSYCAKTKELLEELAGIDRRIVLNVKELAKSKEEAKLHGIDKAPGLLLYGKNPDTHLFYFGIPAARQFAALLEDIVDLSNNKTRLSPVTIAALQKVTKPLEVSVFVSITDELCPGSVRIAHQFAMESNMIWASMIDAEHFTELAIHNSITKVPKIIVNGLLYVEEPLNEDEFLEHVLSSV